MPREPVVFGVGAHAEVLERGPVEAGEDERLVPGRLRAGVDVDQRERRRPRLVDRRGPGVDLERGLVAQPAQRRRPVREQVVVAPRSSRSRNPVSCQIVSHFGALDGMSFCQKPGCPAPFGKRWRLSGRSTRCGSIAGRDPREVGDELALRGRRLVDAVTRREQHLVEVGELELLAADVPGPLALERGERLELRVGHEPRRVDGGRGAFGAALRRVAFGLAFAFGAAFALRGCLRLRRLRVRCHRLRPSRFRCHGRDPLDGRERGGRLAIRDRRVDRLLLHDLARVAADLEALERRLADAAVARPAADLGPDDELRADPADARRGRRPSGPCSRAAAPGRTAAASVSSASRRARRSFRVRPSKPEPTLPANRSRSPSYTPTTTAPSSFAFPSPGVQPPTTSSCSGRALILSHADDRRPELVARAPLLGDDPLQPLGLDRLEERDALGVDVARELDPGVRPEHELAAASCAARAARRRASARRGRAGRTPGTRAAPPARRGTT